MTIGIPRGLLYYRYGELWQTFLRELGCPILVSPETNRRIVEEGIRHSIDESCLPSKIYLGHVAWLLGRCDCILVPRVAGIARENDVCVKFYAMYDIARNTFPDVRFLECNIDICSGQDEKTAFLRLGNALGMSRLRALYAYQAGKSAQEAADAQKRRLQKEALEGTDAQKILLVSHPYNSRDAWIGEPVARLVSRLGGVCLYADAEDPLMCRKYSEEYSRSLSWLFNRELIGAIRLLEGKIDGMILLTAFPCGPDSLVNELVIRRCKSVPILELILDELQGEAGLETRLESFMDILQDRRNAGRVAAHA